MSIHVNQKRKQYFICYKATLEDGTQKTITITNSEWKTNLVGKKYMQSIEQDEIEKDRKKRRLRIRRKDGTIITLDDLIYDYVTYIYNHIKNTTAYNREKNINKYIRSFFKINKPLDEVFTVQTINSFINHLSSNKQVKKNTLNNIIGILRDMLKFAMRMEYIPFELGNKLDLLLTPLKNNEVEEHKIKVWTTEQLNTFFNSFDDNDKYKYLFELLYKGALRLGEALALQWKDLDVNEYRIHVYKTADQTGEITPPKTKASSDYVYLPKSCVENLLKLKEMLCAEEEDFMFFGGNRPYIKAGINKKMEKVIKENGLPALTPHGLRHSCATTMIYKGVSIQDVSHHLRHRDIGITLNTYVHWLPKNMQKTLEEVF